MERCNYCGCGDCCCSEFKLKNKDFFLGKITSDLLEGIEFDGKSSELVDEEIVRKIKRDRSRILDDFLTAYIATNHKEEISIEDLCLIEQPTLIKGKPAIRFWFEKKSNVEEFKNGS